MDVSPARSSNNSDPPNEMQLMQEAFLDALVATGVLGKVKAQLRAAAVGIVRDDAARINASSPNDHPSRMSEPSKIALLLVHDFLQCMNYNLTEGVFAEEASVADLDGMDPAEPLGLATVSERKPLLVTLVEERLSGAPSSAPHHERKPLDPTEFADPDADLHRREVSPIREMSPETNRVPPAGRQTGAPAPAAVVSPPYDESSVEYSDHTAGEDEALETLPVDDFETLAPRAHETGSEPSPARSSEQQQYEKDGFDSNASDEDQF